MPPKNALAERGGKVDFGTPKDLALSHDMQGYSISHQISVKGFCVIDPGVSQVQLDQALTDVQSLDSAGRFAQPPVPVTPGLLGVTGSARIAELEASAPSAEKSDADGLRALDSQMVQWVGMAAPYMGELGVEMRVRTAGLVHEAGMPPGEGPPLTPHICAKWLGIFGKQKLMCIWCLGPDEGTLELQPFDEECNGYKVPLRPGLLVILRADALSHTFSSAGRAFCLSCFMQTDSFVYSKYQLEFDEGTPCCKALEEWAQEAIRNYKEADPEEQAFMDPLPRHWELYMNHTHMVSQHVCVRTAATRMPSCWDPYSWAGSYAYGPDFGIEVPMMRFNMDYHFNLDQYCYTWNQTNSRHGNFIDGIELFDNTMFRISRAEALGMDTGHKSVMETGYEALIKDGYKISTIMNSRGGVYVANPPPSEWGATEKEILGAGVCGSGGSIACGRFSFVHGIKGPCISLDVEGASSLMCATFACTNLNRTGQWEPIPYAVCASWNHFLNHMSYVHLMAQGRLSPFPQGRAMTFDASATGFVRGDTGMAFVLKSMTNLVDNEVVMVDDGKPFIGSLAGSSANQSGKRASITTPDAASMQDCIADAIRIADVSPLDCDACETSCVGRILEDAVESSVTGKCFRPSALPGLEETPCLSMNSFSTNNGHLLEAAGYMQILKVLLASSWGAMQPNLHLRVLNPHMDMDICDRALVIPSEVWPYRLSSNFTGITNTSWTGSNCHMLCYGQVTDERCAPLPAPTWHRDAIVFWPEGGGSIDADAMPKRGYSIAGSFNKWNAEPMETEGPGVYAYTVTLGENLYERFQIYLDGDARKVLHPNVRRSDKGLPLFGPMEALRRDVWFLDGRSTYRVPTLDGGIEYETLESEDVGELGSQYRIRLRIAGKWRTVDWEKLDEEEKKAAPACSYQISGTWNDGKPQAMAKDPDVPGLYTAEVTLPSDNGGMFHIIRDGDWDQAIYPMWDGADATAEVLGPEEPIGHAWALPGRAGDVFRIEFQRLTEAGKDTMKVSWNMVRNDTPTQAMREQAERAQYFVSGSWNEGAEFYRMDFTGEYYQFYVELGSSKMESFRIFQNASLSRCLYPSVANASPHTQHELQGPEDAFGSVTWTIGHHDADLPEKGKRYEVRLFLDESRKPVKVDWLPVRGIDGLEDARGRGFYAYGT